MYIGRRSFLAIALTPVIAQGNFRFNYENELIKKINKKSEEYVKLQKQTEIHRKNMTGVNGDAELRNLFRQMSRKHEELAILFGQLADLD